MSNMEALAPQGEAVRLTRGPARWARNVAPAMAVYGDGDVNARVGIEQGLTPAASAEDVELRVRPFMVEAEHFVERVKLWRGRVRVERIVDPHDGVIMGGGGCPGQVHMFKFREGHGRNKLGGGVRNAVKLTRSPSRRACRTVGVVVEQPVLNEQYAVGGPVGDVGGLLPPPA